MINGIFTGLFILLGIFVAAWIANRKEQKSYEKEQAILKNIREKDKFYANRRFGRCSQGEGK